jgi:hypothetical protein
MFYSQHRSSIDRQQAMTQAAVRRSLAQKELAEAIDGTAFIMHTEISPSALISLGIDLELEQ